MKVVSVSFWEWVAAVDSSHDTRGRSGLREPSGERRPVGQQRPAGPAGFGAGPVVVGMIPDQDPVVVLTVVKFAAATGTSVVGGYVDPSSSLIEWDHEGRFEELSLRPAIEPDDEAAAVGQELAGLLADVADGFGVAQEFRLVAGDPALALGRLAVAVGASAVVVGARRPGLVAGAQEILTGSVVHKLVATYHVPVRAVPRPDAHAHHHG